MSSAITCAILEEIVNVMRQGFNIGRYKWTTKELSNDIRKILGPNITNDKVRYILEEYQGCILTPWRKSTYGDKVTWELYE